VETELDGKGEFLVDFEDCHLRTLTEAFQELY